MKMPNSLRLTILASVIFTFGAIAGFAQCNNIDVEVKVVSNEGNNGSSIVIAFKDVRAELFETSLFGPNKNNVLNTTKTEFKNLTPGKYLVVIVGKREDNKFCPKSINVTIN